MAGSWTIGRKGVGRLEVGVEGVGGVVQGCSDAGIQGKDGRGGWKVYARSGMLGVFSLPIGA